MLSSPQDLELLAFEVPLSSVLDKIYSAILAVLPCQCLGDPTQFSLYCQRERTADRGTRGVHCLKEHERRTP